MSALRKAENFTPCRWPDCPYYGRIDEGGNACDQAQVDTCEKIRAREEINCKHISGDTRCAAGSEPGYTDWCVLGPCSIQEENDEQ